MYHWLTMHSVFFWLTASSVAHTMTIPQLGLSADCEEHEDNEHDPGAAYEAPKRAVHVGDS